MEDVGFIAPLPCAAGPLMRHVAKLVALHGRGAGTPDEAAAYLNGVMGLALTAQDVSALEGRTEGWIAALQLAALSMQGRDDVASFIASFTGDDRYIVDYLVEEVLQRQTDAVRRFREACGEAHMKAILATGELATLGNVARASMVAMQAGADFIKTSTGKEDVNATLPVSLVMLRALRDYRERSGVDIGFKPAGGLRTAKDALAWLILMKEELGVPWMQPDLFRIGASGLLTDIERQLDHYATGRYSAAHRHAMA